MQLNLLGPFELRTSAGNPIEVVMAKRRAVLAALGVQVNRIVAVEDLLALVWGAAPPEDARTALHGHISHLRKLLEPSVELATRSPGYVLLADPAAVDVHRAGQVVDRGAGRD